MSAKSDRGAMPKKTLPPDKNKTPSTSVPASATPKTTKNILPPLMCSTCKNETENDSDIFKCDGCLGTYHIQCDNVRKGDVTARASSVHLRLFCTSCSRRHLDILNCEKLSIIYDYVVKIDSHTQKHVEKQTDAVSKLATVISETRMVNKKIGEIKTINSGQKPSFSSVLKQNKKPVVIIKPKNENQLCNKTVEEVKAKISQREINASGIRNVRNGGIAINCDSNQSTVQLKQIIEGKLGDEYVVSLPQIKKPRVKIVGVCDVFADDEIVGEIKEQNDYLSNAVIEVIKILKKTEKDRPYDIVIEIDYDNYLELMKTKFINLGWKRCKIFDHVHITRCYKCCGFAHISTNCTNKKTCSKCGGEHDFKECDKETLSCINCLNMNRKYGTKHNCEHHALSSKCETTKFKILQLSKKIQFKEIP